MLYEDHYEEINAELRFLNASDILEDDPVSQRTITNIGSGEDQHHVLFGDNYNVRQVF